MVTEYVGVCGHLPDPDLSWPLFLLVVKSAAQFEARAMLRAMLGTAYGASAVMGGSKSGALQRTAQDLQRVAYPGGGGGTPSLIENLAAKDNG